MCTLIWAALYSKRISLEDAWPALRSGLISGAYRLEALDMTILLERREDDIEEPEAEEDTRGKLLSRLRTAQLSTGNLGVTAIGKSIEIRK